MECGPSVVFSRQCLVRPDQKQARFSENVRLLLLDRSGNVKTPDVHLTGGHAVTHSEVINISLSATLGSPLLRGSGNRENGGSQIRVIIKQTGKI